MILLPLKSNNKTPAAGEVQELWMEQLEVKAAVQTTSRLWIYKLKTTLQGAVWGLFPLTAILCLWKALCEIWTISKMHKNTETPLATQHAHSVRQPTLQVHSSAVTEAATTVSSCATTYL